MEFIFITDLHGNAERISQLPSAELLVVGGDLTSFGSAAEVGSLLDRLLSRYDQVLAISGNCDPATAAPEFASRGVDLHLRWRSGSGISFLGCGGSNHTPFETPCEWEEPDMACELRKLVAAGNPAGAQPVVLVSHVPPKGSGADLLPGGGSAGSTAVADCARTLRPALVLCGHIHEAVGVFAWEGLTVVNPGPARGGRYAVVKMATAGMAPAVELGRV